MRPSLSAALLVLASCAGPAATPSPAPLPRAQALRDTLVAQFAASAAAWNRGDLGAFMSDYARDTTTSFVSRGRVQHGFDWIWGNYAPRFEPGAARDSLRFESLEARPLAPTLALVTARYILFRGGRTTSSGPFTLVMEHRPDGWKILHDHTSSD